MYCNNVRPRPNSAQEMKTMRSIYHLGQPFEMLGHFCIHAEPRHISSLWNIGRGHSAWVAGFRRIASVHSQAIKTGNTIAKSSNNSTKERKHDRVSLRSLDTVCWLTSLLLAPPHTSCFLRYYRSSSKSRPIDYIVTLLCNTAVNHDG